MKKFSIRMSTFLALGMLMFSCSVERNSVTRGGESSYGIGSGLAMKQKKRDSQSGSSEHALLAEVQESKMPVAASLEDVVSKSNDENVSTAVAERNISYSLKAPVFHKLAVKSAGFVNKQLFSEKSMKAPVAKKAIKGESKSWYLTLFLCFFFGTLGLHRVYLGYSWQAWLQLITLGGLGIWSFIDLIRIILKKLEPRCGIYEDI